MSRELYSIEAEHGVLGALMLDGTLCELVFTKLDVADFYDPDNAFVFQSIQACHEMGQPIDAVTVGVEFPVMPSGERTIAYAAEIAHNVPSTANWSAYAKVVRERAILRRVVAAADQIRELAEDDRSVPEIIAAAQQATADLRDLDDGEPEYRLMGDAAAEVIEIMQAKLDGTAPKRLSTGLNDLDLLTGGLRQKGMIVIAGRPGSGKTTLGLQIAQHTGIQSGGVGLIFSLEMDDIELTTRSIASIGGVDLRRLDDVVDLNDDEWSRVTSAVSKIQTSRLYLCDKPGLTVQAIRSISRQVQRNHGLSVVVVDYIGLLGTTGRYGSRTEAIGSISTALKNLAKELSVPVIVLAQLNRDSTKRAGSKKPQASDLRDSGQIEQDADAIILVHRDMETEEGQNGVTELILDKARQAKVGSCLVQQQGQFARFVNFAGSREVSREEVEIGRSFQSKFQKRGVAA